MQKEHAEIQSLFIKILFLKMIGIQNELPDLIRHIYILVVPTSTREFPSVKYIEP